MKVFKLVSIIFLTLAATNTLADRYNIARAEMLVELKDIVLEEMEVKYKKNFDSSSFYLSRGESIDRNFFSYAGAFTPTVYREFHLDTFDGITYNCNINFNDLTLLQDTSIAEGFELSIYSCKVY
jgi:hypothetical protein